MDYKNRDKNMIINKVNMTVSTFKARYDSDKEFREAHLAYIKTQVKCIDCGRVVTRCNMTRHRKSNWHIKHSLNISNISGLEERKKEIKNIYNQEIRNNRKKIKKTEKEIEVIKKEKQRELDKINRKINKQLDS